MTNDQNHLNADPTGAPTPAEGPSPTVNQKRARRVCKIVIMILIMACLTVIVFVLSGCSMENLPEGELINEFPSPNDRVVLRVYRCGGNATTDFSIRGEVYNKGTGKTKNIYWNYHEDDAEVVWISDDTVRINDVELHIETDVYDWRTADRVSNK